MTHLKKLTLVSIHSNYFGLPVQNSTIRQPKVTHCTCVQKKVDNVSES